MTAIEDILWKNVLSAHAELLGFCQQRIERGYEAGDPELCDWFSGLEQYFGTEHTIKLKTAVNQFIYYRSLSGSKKVSR